MPYPEKIAPTATGYVSYDVKVPCPHCEALLQLNQYPYDDEESEYFLENDELGKALFGSNQEPAKWMGLRIKYKCCRCKKDFTLNRLET